MSREQVQLEVATGLIIDYQEKNGNKPHKVTLEDENIYSTFNSLDADLEKGQIVQIQWFENSKGYKTIEDITVVEEAGGSKTDGSVKSSPEKSEGAEASPTQPLTIKEERIATQVAFKAAAQKTDPGENLDNHFNEVKALSNGYRNILLELMKE